MKKTSGKFPPSPTELGPCALHIPHSRCWFMTHVTCRLTAKNRDQLRKPTLGNRAWAAFTFSTLTAGSLLSAQASASGVMPACCSLISSVNSSYTTSPADNDRLSCNAATNNNAVYKKLSYRRGTARCVVSVKILPTATQQVQKLLVRQVRNQVSAVAN